MSPSGSDSNAGTEAAPWQTVARVNRASLQPGDTVLFQGGKMFSGTTLLAAGLGNRFGADHVWFLRHGSGAVE